MSKILGKSILNKFVLHRHLWIVAAHGTSPVDPFQKHGQLCLRQCNRSTCRLRPDKSSALQSFREKTKAIARPPQKFNQITASPTKYENVTRKWVLLQRRLHHATQPRKSSSQIGHSCGDPDSRSCRQSDHPTRHSKTVRSASASTLPVTRTCPFASLISMVPTEVNEDPQPSLPDLLHAGSDKVTGTSLLDCFLPSRPSRYFFRQ